MCTLFRMRPYPMSVMIVATQALMAGIRELYIDGQCTGTARAG